MAGITRIDAREGHHHQHIRTVKIGVPMWLTANISACAHIAFEQGGVFHIQVLLQSGNRQWIFGENAVFCWRIRLLLLAFKNARGSMATVFHAHAAATYHVFQTLLLHELHQACPQ